MQGSRKPSIGEYLIFACLVLAYFVTFFFRVSASVVLPALSVEWGMDAALAGFISSLYFYTYGLMQPISGALSDRFGPSTVVAAGLVLGSLGSVIFGLAKGPALLALGRLVIGLGLSPMLTGVLVFQGTHFDKSKYALYSGITFFVGNVGAVVAVTPLGMALDTWGRGASFIAMAVVSSALALVLVFLRRHDTLSSERAGASEGKGMLTKKMAGAFRAIKESRQLAAACVMWGAILGPLLALQGLWAVSWCDAVYPGDLAAARLWATMIGIGIMVGNILTAASKSIGTKKRKAVSYGVVVYAVSWALLCVLMQIKAPYVITMALASLVGASAGVSHTLLTAVVDELSPKGEGGSVFGLVNMIGFALTILSQSLTGFVINAMSGGSVYAPKAFTAAFAIIALIAAVPVLCIKALAGRSVSGK